MAQHMTHSKLFPDFDRRHAELFGEHIVHLEHNAHNASLFTDDALARLLEQAPRETYHVNTMNPETHDPKTRREGEIVGLSGHEVLEAVRSGMIWILLQNPGRVDPSYNTLMADHYAEFERLVPGLETFKHNMTILISSPKVQVYYHSDVPGQTLWQVRGRKRVYVYPNTAPFLPPEKLEKIILGEAHEISLDYEPWFDDYATVIDLEPGKMLHWPLNCPHRVVNEDCLNISFTTEHWTNDLRRAYAVNYANGVMRRYLPKSRFLADTSGMAAIAKIGLAAAHKLSGMNTRSKQVFPIDFRVDPAAPNSVRPIDTYILNK